MSTKHAEFNEDELHPPQWLNEEFIVAVLKAHEQQGTELTLEKVKFTPATKKGDHYASVMFRAVVDYKANATPKCQSLIVKTLPELEGQKKDLLSQSFIFETEIGMYTEVLPRFEENLRKAGDKTTLKPPCLYYSLSPHKVLVLDDIVPKGFELIRDRAMTMEEAKAAYERLAKWHAVSFKIIKQEPHFFDKYQHGLFTMPNLLNEGLMTDGIKFFIEMLKKKATLHQFVPHFEALRPVILQRCLDTFREFRETPRADAYYVLCHGDFTIKNMMFKHNSADGSLVDVQLLDFQLSYVGSIASDLIYSMVQLLDEHLRKQFPILVEYYFNIFIETLLKLKYKGALPKLEKLREQLVWHKHFELFLITTFLPIWYMLREQNVDPVDLHTSAEYRRSMYRNQSYIAEMEQLLPKYLNLGYFGN